MVKSVSPTTAAIDDVEYHRAVRQVELEQRDDVRHEYHRAVRQVEAEQRKASAALLARIKART